MAPAPKGWNFWIEEDQPAPRAPWAARHWRASTVLTLLGGLAVGTLLGSAPSQIAPLAAVPAVTPTITVSAPPVTLTPAPVTVTPAAATVTVTVTETAPAPAPQPQAWASVPAETEPAEEPEADDTDPHFGTCKEAKANGYGNYRKGVDPEYGWYRDADGDGVVCE